MLINSGIDVYYCGQWMDETIKTQVEAGTYVFFATKMKKQH